MHVVLPGVGLGTVCVTVAADAHSASSSLSGGHAWEPLQTCGAGGHLQRGQLGVELPHPGLDSWLVEKRLCRDRRWSVCVCLPVTLTPGCCLLACLGGNPLLLTSLQVLQTSCSVWRCFSSNLLLLTSSQVVQTSFSVCRCFSFYSALVAKPIMGETGLHIQR